MLSRLSLFSSFASGQFYVMDNTLRVILAQYFVTIPSRF